MAIVRPRWHGCLWPGTDRPKLVLYRGNIHRERHCNPPGNGRKHLSQITQQRKIQHKLMKKEGILKKEKNIYTGSRLQRVWLQRTDFFASKSLTAKS